MDGYGCGISGDVHLTIIRAGVSEKQREMGGKLIERERENFLSVLFSVPLWWRKECVTGRKQPVLFVVLVSVSRACVFSLIS